MISSKKTTSAIFLILVFFSQTTACGGPLTHKTCDKEIISLRSFLETKVESDVRSGWPLDEDVVEKLNRFDQRISECASNAKTVPNIGYYFRVVAEINSMLNLLNADRENQDLVIRKHFLISLEEAVQIRRRH